MGTRIGEMTCRNEACRCPEVEVQVTSAGNWQAKCHKCGFPTFGKAGTKWRRQMEATTKLDEDAPPADPEPSPSPAPPPPEPAKKPASSVFDLAHLS